MNTFKKYLDKLIAFSGTDTFTKTIIGLLVLQALWIALSGRYAMAFDEEFHFGVIKLYAAHPFPFWSAHPAAGDAFGAITRDPSYLYHYLFSFIYRLIAVFTSSVNVQVSMLRFMNIALFASCIPLFKRVLVSTGATKAAANLTLMVFIFIPIVPFLAAQINYDNLTLPLLAIALLYAIEVIRKLRQSVFDARLVLKLLALSLVCSLVKYASVPLLLGMFGVLLFYIVRSPMSARTLASQTKNDIVAWRGAGKWVTVGLLVLLSVLFAERYGVNMARYHTPVPDCAQVLSYDHCKHYGPWIRDFDFSQNKSATFDSNPVRYTQHWFYGMWFRSFFAVDGPATNFETRGPLTLPALSAVAAGSLGGIALLLSGPRIWRRYDKGVLLLLAASGATYVVILWLTEYQLYTQTGQAVAINGRYLLPILPFLILLCVIGIRLLPYFSARRSMLLGSVVLICLVSSGGALTFILRSRDEWYMPGSPMRVPNHAIKEVLGPITPGYDNPVQYLH